MSLKNVDPPQARELLEGDEGYTYLDVRSIPEFENGHPAGAVNVPILHQDRGAMVPNPDFLRVVESHFDRSAKLIVGCQSGGRSTRAAEALTACGFTAIVHMDGGFGGARDPLGRVVTPGWAESGFPIEFGAAEGRSYQSLASQGGG